MKLQPRVRNQTALYEMDRDSNFLLMFRNKDNAFMFTKEAEAAGYDKKAVLNQIKAKKDAKVKAEKAKKAAEKKAAEDAKKAAAVAKKAAKKAPKVTLKKVAGGAKVKKAAAAASSGPTVNNKAPKLAAAFSAIAIPSAPPLTKQQSQTALTLARQGSQTHRWEFVNDQGGWSKYSPEASKLVEMEYQAWQQQPAVFVRSVRSGDWHYSVNFTKMEQTNINHPGHRVRKIRRSANF